MIHPLRPARIHRSAVARRNAGTGRGSCRGGLAA